VCKAQVAKAPIAAAAAASLTSLIAAHPAFALVGSAQLGLFCTLRICPTQIQALLLYRLMTVLEEKELARF